MMNLDELAFSGIQYVSVHSLGISQIYLSESKIRNVQTWFRAEDLSCFAPLPVHDFGNGRLTLTDGHTRAHVACQAGINTIPVVYDNDEIVTSDEGIALYRNDIAWCDRFHLRSVCDLAERIVGDADYERLWKDRCDVGYHLIVNSSHHERLLWQKQHSDLFLFGVSRDKQKLYFENNSGGVFVFKAK